MRSPWPPVPAPRPETSRLPEVLEAGPTERQLPVAWPGVRVQHFPVFRRFSFFSLALTELRLGPGGSYFETGLCRGSGDRYTLSLASQTRSHREGQGLSRFQGAARATRRERPRVTRCPSSGSMRALAAWLWAAHCCGLNLCSTADARVCVNLRSSVTVSRTSPQLASPSLREHRIVSCRTNTLIKRIIAKGDAVILKCRRRRGSGICLGLDQLRTSWFKVWFVIRHSRQAPDK